MQKYICPTAAYFDCGWCSFFILLLYIKWSNRLARQRKREFPVIQKFNFEVFCASFLQDLKDLPFLEINFFRTKKGFWGQKSQKMAIFLCKFAKMWTTFLWICKKLVYFKIKNKKILDIFVYMLYNLYIIPDDTNKTVMKIYYV